MEPTAEILRKVRIAAMTKGVPWDLVLVLVHEAWSISKRLYGGGKELVSTGIESASGTCTLYRCKEYGMHV